MVSKQLAVGATAATVLLLVIGSFSLAQDQCRNSLEIVGTDATGNRVTKSLPLIKQIYDYTPDVKTKDTQYWENFMGMKSMKQVSTRQNCAGFVLDKLWHIGSYNSDQPLLYEVAQTFGVKVRPEDLQEGDIVFYGPTIHVAIVVEVSGGRVTIEGKDNQAPYFRYFNGSESGDAMVRWGSKEYWRLTRVRGTPSRNPTDDCPPCVTPTITCPGSLNLSCMGQVEKEAKADIESIAKKVRRQPDPRYNYATPSPNVTFKDIEDTGSGRRGDPKTITRGFKAIVYCERETRPDTYNVVPGTPSSCNQIIRVEDAEPPTIPGLAAQVTAECENELQEPQIGYTIIGADNCGGEVKINYKDSRKGRGCPSDPLIITRTFTATDTAGNSRDFVQKITVADKTPPRIVRQPPTLRLKTTDKIPDPNSVPVFAEDNCSRGDVQVKWLEDKAVNPGSGRAGDPRILERRYQVSDACGNTAREEVIQRIVIEDEKPPTVGEQTFSYPTIDGYRLDRCRTWGTDCEEGAANAFCRSKGFRRAKSWEIDYDIGERTPTKIIGTGQICKESFCDGFKSIVCEGSLISK